MIDVQISDQGYPEWTYITTTDLSTSKRVVYLGGNIDKLNEAVRTRFSQHVFPPHLSEKISKSTMPATMFFHEGIEDLLTHEICHILIYELTGSLDATKGLDRLDYACKDVYDVLIVCDER